MPAASFKPWPNAHLNQLKLNQTYKIRLKSHLTVKSMTSWIEISAGSTAREKLQPPPTCGAKTCCSFKMIKVEPG